MNNPADAYDRWWDRADYAKVDVLLQEPDGTSFSYIKGPRFDSRNEDSHSLEIHKKDGFTDIVIKTERVEDRDGELMPPRITKQNTYRFNKRENLVGVTKINGLDKQEHVALGSPYNHKYGVEKGCNLTLTNKVVVKQAMADITKAFDAQLGNMGDRGNEYIKKIDGVLTFGSDQPLKTSSPVRQRG